MSTTKHLAFQKLEPVDMALGDAITPLGEQAARTAAESRRIPLTKLPSSLT